MFSLKQKDKVDFGGVSANDDPDIEVIKIRRSSRSGLWFESLRLMRDVILIVAVFVLFGVFVAQPVVVEGTSMVPELQNGERLIVNKLIYYNFESVSWGHISRGDIVVFWYPEDPEKSFVKRVVGLPGETVEISNGVVYVDGMALEEPYLKKSGLDKTSDVERTKVKDHYYFVMGDNREHSSDSRSWGLVPQKYIYGKAFFRYWRPSKLGFLEHGETQLKETEESQEAPSEEEDPGDDYRAEEES